MTVRTQQEVTLALAAISYNWSFVEPIQRLKRDVQEGAFGRPQRCKGLMLWPRWRPYYTRNRWAGRIRTDDGRWVLDSPVNNATAHPLRTRPFGRGGHAPRQGQHERQARVHHVRSTGRGAARAARDGPDLLDLLQRAIGRSGLDQSGGVGAGGHHRWRGNERTGYLRVDWFTPDGLGVWGDGRLTILGSEGYIGVRKYVDLAGRPGANHLFLVTQDKTRYIDASQTPLSYASDLLYDIRHRTQTAMSQEHCCLAMELALRAQQQADRLGHLTGEK